MRKKYIFLWALYDFANSIVMIVFFLYFSQWLVIDQGVSDFWFNAIFVGSTVLLIFTAPAFGMIADRMKKHFTFLKNITFLVVLTHAFTAVITLFFPHLIWLAALSYLLANYFYQFAFLFYNPLLHEIAPPSKVGLMSGIGQGANSFGQLIGVLVAIPFAGGAFYLFGEPGRAQTFLPATILFFLLALPFLLFFKTSKIQQVEPVEKPSLLFRQASRSQWHHFKELCKAPGMGYFLLGYFFFNDAILTVSNNFPIYLEQVYHVTDDVKSYLLGGVLITGILGALVSGWVSDKIGLKNALLIVLGAWAIVFPLMSVIKSFPIYVVLAVTMGFLFGAVWAVTRAVMVSLCPKDKLNFGFGFYTLAERFSSIAGPLSWGLITSLMVSYGETRYRVAIGSMALFIIFGVFMVRKIPKHLFHKIPEEAVIQPPRISL